MMAKRQLDRLSGRISERLLQAIISPKELAIRCDEGRRAEYAARLGRRNPPAHRLLDRGLPGGSQPGLGADSDRIEAEIISEAKEMVQQHPDMGAILLECSLMPPYAASVQNATGLPVFDFITMINYFQEGTHRREYQGYY